MHLDAEGIERLLAGELAAEDAERVRRHVAACRACEEGLKTAARHEAEIADLLRHIDHAPPEVALEQIVGHEPPDRKSWWRIAAGVVLVIASSGLLYAWPGSPLPELLRGAASRSAAPEPSPRPNVSSAVAGPPAGAGVAVVPAAVFTIDFRAAQKMGAATVRIVDAHEVSIRSTAPVAFDVQDGGVAVANSGARADYDVVLPRRAPLVRITVGSETLLVKRHGSVTTAAEQIAPDTYRLPIRASGG